MRPVSSSALFLAALTANGSPLAQDGLHAELAWVGIYRVADTRPIDDPGAPAGRSFFSAGAAPVERTTTVPAEVGTRFGVGFLLKGAPVDQSVQYQVVWRFPAGGMRSPDGRTWFEHRSPSYSCPVGKDSPCLAGYPLQNAWELAPGKWTLEVWVEGRRLVEQSFELVTR